jgi:hypothetical protein
MGHARQFYSPLDAAGPHAEILQILIDKNFHPGHIQESDVAARLLCNCNLTVASMDLLIQDQGYSGAAPAADWSCISSVLLLDGLGIDRIAAGLVQVKGCFSQQDRGRPKVPRLQTRNRILTLHVIAVRADKSVTPSYLRKVFSITVHHRLPVVLLTHLFEWVPYRGVKSITIRLCVLYILEFLFLYKDKRLSMNYSTHNTSNNIFGAGGLKKLALVTGMSTHISSTRRRQSITVTSPE